MRKVVRLSIVATLLWTPGVHTLWASAPSLGPTNPFFRPSALPFQAPPFDKLGDGDFQPAIEAGIAEQQREIDAIVRNPSAPTVENTLAALERSGLLLERSRAAFSAVSAANTNPALQAAKTALAPELAAHDDAIHLNGALFARIAHLYKQRDSARYDPESRRLVEVTYREFVRSGAALSDADKTTLKKLNAEAALLSDAFTQKLLAATTNAAFHTPAAAALAGASESQLGAAAQAAQSRHLAGYVVPLQNTTQQPLLSALIDRSTRQAIFQNSWNRAERGDANDTRETVARLAQLRAERAQLLGFPNHAAWKLADQMAKTPAAALRFMNALVLPAAAKVAQEDRDIRAVVDEERGPLTLEPWDSVFYGEKARKAGYAVDELQVKPYFELNRVLIDGVFYAAHELYGVTFAERHDLPVYQADVRVFQVNEADGRPLALFYCDYFKRDNKNGGAWMSSFVTQSTLLGRRPVVYNVANLPKPANGDPALIGFDDVRTMFHEFGHALHGMFADTRYPSLTGTATARDFVEFPSQFNEHWAVYPSVLAHYARHVQTGEAMPAELIQKILRAENATEGYRLTESLAAAELDMQWHLLPAGQSRQDVDEFELRALSQVHLDRRTVPPRYRSSYFSHIWGGEYSAGYYAYLWTQMLDDDAFQWFEDHGGLTRANGEKFRQQVLSKGNTVEVGSLYVNWRGRPPTNDAMMKYRGLTTAP
ncbi:MAG: M3 family metallopeptidase [Pseudomonadota bacterium]|nr:M3 family metallopeptidase [Pseudomonadota bacterium]